MHDRVVKEKDVGPDEIFLGLPGEAMASFGRPTLASDGSGMWIPLRLVGRGVQAETSIELETWHEGPRRFIEFFTDLADAWRGWDGKKEWHDDGPNVSVIATHDGIGVISLDFTADPFAASVRPGSWKVTVRVPVEPGSLAAIAGRLADFVAEAH